MEIYRDFFISIASSDINLLQRIINSKFDVNSILVEMPDELCYNSPLYIAVVFRRTEVVKILLEAGADPNFQNTYGFTPLFIAIRLSKNNNMLEIIKLLLNFGAKVNVYSMIGSIEICAALYAPLDVFSLLLENGMDFTSRKKFHTGIGVIYKMRTRNQLYADKFKLLEDYIKKKHIEYVNNSKFLLRL